MDVRFTTKPTLRVALGIIIILGVSIVVTTVVLMSLSATTNEEGEFEAASPTICTTPLCVNEATYISSIIDNTTNPCREFYKFARGKSNGNEFDLMKEKIQQQFINLYNEPIQEGEHVMVTSMKMLYRMCLQELPFTFLYAPVTTITKAIEIFESSSWNKTTFDWLETTCTLYHKFGHTSPIFFDLSVIVDPRNGSKHIFKISLPKLAIVQKEMVTKVVKALGTDLFIAEDEITAIHNFVGELLKEEDVLERTFATVEKHISYGPKQNVLLSRLAATIIKLVHPIVFSDDDILFEEPTKILNRLMYIESQPKRVIANYMLWRVLEEIVQEMYLNFTLDQMPITDLSKTIHKYCFEKIYNRFIPNPMDVLYVKRYTTSDQLRKVGTLATNIKGEFLAWLRTVDWIPLSKRNKFIDELENVPMVIGAPENFVSEQLLDDLNMEMSNYRDADDFLSLWLYLKRNYQRFSYQLFTKSVANAKFHRWNLMEVTEVVVDPVYAHNITVLPATILQGVLYSENRPNYLNYATLGRILLAELLVYNNFIEAYGNSPSNYIYHFPSSMREFRKVTYCPMTKGLTAGLCVNSSFVAYKKWERTSRTVLQLPDIDYTNNQLFWIFSVPFGLNDDNYVIDEMAKGNLDVAQTFDCL